jgi:predicted nucleic acid-binding protein
MAYLDTDVILAYCIDGDPQHSKAVNILEKLRQNTNRFYVSPLTLVELYSVLSRNIQSYKLPPGIEELTNHRSKLRTTITYFLQLLSINIPSDEAKLTDLDGLKLFHKFLEAIDLATKLKLKTLDLLHIAYASQLAKKKLIQFFITFDSKILENKEAILKNTGIEVIDG